MGVSGNPGAVHIAIQSVRGQNTESRNYEIEVLRVADRVRSRLSDNHHYDGMTAWSSDGALLTFISDRDGYDAVYVTAADRAMPRRLTTSASLNPNFTR